MAFAPYYLLGKVLGEFIEKDYGKYFDYAERDEDEVLAWAGDYPHKVYVGGPVGGNGWRPAVAYVVVDEDDYGKPVVEKWFLKKNVVFPPL